MTGHEPVDTNTQSDAPDIAASGANESDPVAPAAPEPAAPEAAAPEAATPEAATPDLARALQDAESAETAARAARARAEQARALADEAEAMLRLRAAQAATTTPATVEHPVAPIEFLLTDAPEQPLPIADNALLVAAPELSEATTEPAGRDSPTQDEPAPAVPAEPVIPATAADDAAGGDVPDTGRGEVPGHRRNDRSATAVDTKDVDHAVADRPGADEGVTRGWQPRATAVLAVLVLLAAAFAALSGVSWSNRNVSAHALSAARDTVVLSATQDVKILNTLDYRSVDAGLAAWSAASAGALHDGLTSISAADKTALAAAKDVTTATVLDVAVQALNAHAGTATVLASVQVVVTPAAGTATTKRERLLGSMSRVGSVWKMSSLAPVGLSF